MDIREPAIDSLTGVPGEDVRKFNFEVDGIIYTMNACRETRDNLRGDLIKYIEASSEHVNPHALDSKVVREWARQRNYPVLSNGRVPDEIIMEYLRAHP